ncbi:MAG: GNAT family N-acetyltransferase [Anaerolineaceae bacterium]|nr:GNAT family N-acetyltransferase [Anaerolineaceae bacterium]
MNNVNIRRVKQGDEKALAYIQTGSWKAAFADIIPPDTLRKCTEITRAENMYAGLLAANKGNGYILEVDGEPHCIAYWDASRTGEMSGYAELICIHSLRANWRKGYGSMMMKRILDDMRLAGFTKVMLWVFEENHRAISFYKMHGFAANGKSQQAVGLMEVMYEREL